MDEVEWISAWEATRFLDAKRWNHSWREAIIRRLHSGLIRSRADRFIYRNTDREYELLDERFWGAKTYAHESSWEAGDFERRIQDAGTAKAFGVCFAKADILALLGPDYSDDAETPQQAKPSPQIKTDKAKGGRPFVYDHPAAAAIVAIRLSRLPKDDGKPWTQVAVMAELEAVYGMLGAGVPKEDTLRETAKGVLRALSKINEIEG